jgi:hypothetical protein
MTLGSAELAPLFYFTPIAFHLSRILKLTEAVCVLSSFSISSTSPGSPLYYILAFPILTIHTLLT